MHSKSKEFAYADMIGQNAKFNNLGFWENAETTATRINDEAARLFENKILTLNFGKPLINEYFEEEE